VTKSIWEHIVLQSFLVSSNEYWLHHIKTIINSNFWQCDFKTTTFELTFRNVSSIHIQINS